MKIKPIQVSSEFNFKYVEIDSSIYTLNSAGHIFSEKAEEIRGSFYNAQINSLPLKKFVYPSYNQMIKDIDKKTKIILDNLNVAKSKLFFKQFQNAYKVYDYLVNSLKYNMLSMEERGNQFEDSAIYFNGLKNNKKRLKGLNLKPASLSERSIYRTKKSIAYNQIAKLNEFLKETMDKRQVSYIKGLYNVLIRGEGVCSDFANAYNFLLEKIGITSYKVISEIKYTNSIAYHAYSLVEFVHGFQKNYYACDLTKSVVNKNNYKFSKKIGAVLGFGMGKKEIINDNCQILSIQKQQGINEGKFYPEIEEEILEKNLPKNLTTKLVTLAEEEKETN